MKLAIIGAGNVGQALAGAAVRAGHSVRISATHVEHAEAAAAATGASAAPSNRAAIEDADVVVLAVPGTAFASLVQDVGAALAGRIVDRHEQRPHARPERHAGHLGRRGAAGAAAPGHG